MEQDTTRSKINELDLDIQELEKLLGEAVRPQVKAILQDELSKKNILVQKLRNSSAGVSNARSQTSTVKIINYAWDQSDNFVKLFVTLNKVEDLQPDAVRTVFESKSVELMVTGLEGKNHSLTITTLHSPIDPEKSYHKVKQNMVVVFMKKTSSKTWPSVSALDQKEKDPGASKFDDAADPSAGIMNLMKKMYNDGDDEMKRTITKAWYEARDKQSDDMFPR